MKMYQCDLVDTYGGETRAYITEKAAVVGKKVKLTDANNPDMIWTVTSVPSIGIEEKYLKELQISYRKQREASDI